MIKKFLYSQKVAPYIFTLPFLIVFCSFFVYPMISTILMSFQSVLPGQTQWIGIDNYRRLLNDKIFFVAVSTSFKYMVVTCALLIPFSNGFCLYDLQQAHEIF